MCKCEVGVFGSSKVDDPSRIINFLDSKKARFNAIHIHYTSGAPDHVINWCQDNRIDYYVYFPKIYNENAQFDKGANFKNFLSIIDNVDIWLAFWDYKSRGTKNLIDLLISRQKQYQTILI